MPSYGISSEPVCWLQTGYPSGYTTKLFGKPVIFREIECVGMGASAASSSASMPRPGAKDAPERAYLGLEWKAAATWPQARRDAGHAASRCRSTAHGARWRSGVSARSSAPGCTLEKVARYRCDGAVHRRVRRRQGAVRATAARAQRRARRPVRRRSTARAIPENLRRVRAVRRREGRLHRRHQPRAPGYFERADGGTLFLDEIGIAHLFGAGQAAARAAGARDRARRRRATGPVDVRVVAATQCRSRRRGRAPAASAQDLYFRLYVSRSSSRRCASGATTSRC